MAVKYTDIDYLVFSEASGFVSLGGSPYERSTYRYTPLLSWMMLPNIWLHESFGKWIFIITDILIGVFIKRILTRIIPTDVSSRFYAWKGWDSNVLINFLVVVWLFNPIAMNVSSRGNAEALISFMVVASLDLLFSHYYIAAAILYGLSVHFKVYPLIFAPSLFMFIDSMSNNGWAPFGFKPLKITKNRIIFTIVSAGTFLLLTWLMYCM